MTIIFAVVADSLLSSLHNPRPKILRLYNANLKVNYANKATNPTLVDESSNPQGVVKEKCP